MYKHGFYSKEAAERVGGVNVYRDLDGNEVLVTCVTDDPMGTGYHWKDKTYIGAVTDFVRHDLPSKLNAQLELIEPGPYVPRRRSE